MSQKLASSHQDPTTLPETRHLGDMSSDALFPGMSERRKEAVMGFSMENGQTLQLSRGCKRHCLICGVDSSAKNREHMGFSRVEQALDYLVARGEKKVNFYLDNEPMEYRDQASGKDLADVLELAHKKGLKTGLTTHGWNIGDEDSKRTGERVAALSFDVDMTFSAHPFHPSILGAKDDAALDAAIKKELARYDEMVEVLLPKKPQLRVIATSLTDQEAGRDLPQIARAKEEFLKHFDGKARGEWNGKIGGVGSTPVLWVGRASDTLEKLGYPLDLVDAGQKMIGEQPVSTLRPNGDVDLVFDDQKYNQYEPVEDVFSGPADPAFRDFAKKLRLIAKRWEQGRDVLGQALPQDIISVADNKEGQDMGVMMETPVALNGAPRIGVSKRMMSYFADIVALPDERAERSDIPDASDERIWEKTRKGIIPLKMPAWIVDSDLTDKDMVLGPQMRTLWDHTGRVERDIRGTVKERTVGRFY